MTRHVLGHCASCGTQVFDIIETFDKPGIEGEPRKLGRPYESAFRATLILASGARADITVCASCVPGLTPNLPEIWARVIHAGVHEFNTRLERGARAASAGLERAYAAQTRRFLTEDAPIGVLTVMRWTDLDSKQVA